MGGWQTVIMWQVWCYITDVTCLVIKVKPTTHSLTPNIHLIGLGMVSLWQSTLTVVQVPHFTLPNRREEEVWVHAVIKYHSNKVGGILESEPSGMLCVCCLHSGNDIAQGQVRHSARQTESVRWRGSQIPWGSLWWPRCVCVCSQFVQVLTE